MKVLREQSRAGSGLGETALTILQAILIAVVIRTLLFRPFNIPSASIEPTLLVGDYLFVSKFSYGYSHYSFEVFRRFKELSENKTAILISHRFSSVRMADRILVLADGKVEAAGTHEELVLQPGRYSELFELQAAGYR
jgi:signal peptidase I